MGQELMTPAQIADICDGRDKAIALWLSLYDTYHATRDEAARLAELDEVRTRIDAMRQGLAALDPALAFIGRQKGMFSTLPLAPDQVKAMREDHAIYMAGSGRINIAGLTPAKLAPLAAAFAAVR